MKVISTPNRRGLAETASLIRHWAKRLLYCNPFYLVSAALLLYGVYHISVHSDFLAGLTPKLVFNFSSLQFYEVLLLITAILLARSRIWYDSTLLVGLENFFVLIPFLLLSQAILLDQLLAWTLGGIAVALAFWRFIGLKHLIPQLNLPFRLLGFGFVLLLLNFALPMTLISFRQSNSPILENILTNAWLFGLPIVAALANLLPHPANQRREIPESNWLPLVFFLIWIAVATIHLWTLGIVYDFGWTLRLLAPLAWVLMWTLINRITDFHPNPDKTCCQIVLGLPAAATLLALSEENINVFFVLSILNILVYGALFLRGLTREAAMHLMLISIAASVAGMPEALGDRLFEHFSRESAAWYSIGAYVIAGAMLSRNPKIGFLGSIATGITSIALIDNHEAHPLFQGMLIFFLLHSLRWEDEKIPGAPQVRLFFGAVWTLYSFLWVYFDGFGAMTTTALLGLLVLAFYVLVSWLRRIWGPLTIPVSAFLVLCSTPLTEITKGLVWFIRALIEFLLNFPIGLLAVVTSFALFAAGTWIAFSKHKWFKTNEAAAKGDIRS